MNRIINIIILILFTFTCFGQVDVNCPVTVITDTDCPIGGINSYDVEIYALGTAQGATDKPGISPAGTLLGTANSSNKNLSIVVSNQTAIDIASSISGTYQDMIVDISTLFEDIQICVRVTDSCGESDPDCDDVYALIPPPTVTIEHFQEAITGNSIDDIDTVVDFNQSGTNPATIDDCVTFTLTLDSLGTTIFTDTYTGAWGTDVPVAFLDQFGIVGGVQSWNSGTGEWTLTGYSLIQTINTPINTDFDFIWDVDINQFCSVVVASDSDDIYILCEIIVDLTTSFTVSCTSFTYNNIGNPIDSQGRAIQWEVVNVIDANDNIVLAGPITMPGAFNLAPGRTFAELISGNFDYRIIYRHENQMGCEAFALYSTSPDRYYHPSACPGNIGNTNIPCSATGPITSPSIIGPLFNPSYNDCVSYIRPFGFSCGYLHLSTLVQSIGIPTDYQRVTEYWNGSIWIVDNSALRPNIPNNDVLTKNGLFYSPGDQIRVTVTYSTEECGPLFHQHTFTY